ncbi:metallophosphoesterase, partial [Virgibacillus halodenitrificans]|nr:metallophosphoesterase [Virgibacillus halodenitrificans]
MAPHLLITEIVPDSTNVNGADGYEFIEVYNNTDQLINFKDYNFRYRYPSGPDNDQVWRAIPNDVWLQPGKVMVFWVMNDKNKELTIADFNSNYNTNLIEGETLVKLDGNSMSNSRKRSIVVSTNTGYEIVKATYNDGVDDTQPDKGIFYKYPEDETNVMVQTGAGVEQANPGSIEDTQVPESVVNIEEDTTPPTIENLTTVKETTATELVEISAESRDESLVKTFKLFYKNTEDSTFKSVNLTKNNEDSLYSHT